MKIEVLELARREFEDAFVNYESRRAGLGEEFRAAVKMHVRKIKDHPDAWMLIRPGIRKCLATDSPMT